MFFTINAYKLLPGFDETYRLSKNETWEPQKNLTSYDSEKDMHFTSFTSANDWLQSNNPIIVNGETVDLNEKVSILFGGRYEFEIIAHRITKPSNPIFTREEISNVLRSGNDNHSNSLVIDYQGNPKLVPLIDRTPLSLKEYPVRFETFQAGNGYVGPHEDLTHLDTTYLALLEAWELHIITGRSIYRDYVSGELSEDELKTNIMEIVNILK